MKVNKRSGVKKRILCSTQVRSSTLRLSECANHSCFVHHLPSFGEHMSNAKFILVVQYTLCTKCKKTARAGFFVLKNDHAAGQQGILRLVYTQQCKVSTAIRVTCIQVVEEFIRISVCNLYIVPFR